MAKNIDEILNAILDIDNGADLDRVVETARVRRDQLAGNLASSLRIGDRVRIGSIKPRYFEGLTGVVAAPATGQRVSIRLDDPTSINPRYLQDGDTVRVPTSVIELVARASDTDTSGPEAAGADPAQPSS